MILLKQSVHLAGYLSKLKAAGRTIGFVPTMGALHSGHLSLLQASAQNNHITVCSIFINPTQFNNAADFSKYPVTLEQDIRMLVAANVDFLFLPDVREIYPDGINHVRHYDLGNLENSLEGKYRPGHFQGVCQVMDRLLGIVAPHNLYMGRKDYQQCMVVKKLLNILQLHTRLNTCATQREPDGLAMSSRNMRLKDDDRQHAVAINQVLMYVCHNLQPGSTDDIIQTGKEMLAQHHFNVDYFTIADAGTLQPVPLWDGRRELVALIAASISDVRLIDNIEIKNK